jgi:hypothetical protein
MQKLKEWLKDQIRQEYAKCETLRQKGTNDSMISLDEARTKAFAYTLVLEQMELMETKPKKAKTKILKLDRLSQICQVMEGDKLYLGSSKHSSTYPLDPYYGKVALSFKQGKKRIIIKGTITAEQADDCKEFGLFWYWYFIPKNAHALEKLKTQQAARKV